MPRVELWWVPSSYRLYHYFCSYVSLINFNIYGTWFDLCHIINRSIYDTHKHIYATDKFTADTQAAFTRAQEMKKPKRPKRKKKTGSDWFVAC